MMTTPNWANRTLFTGDNLGIMRGMNSESVDLIYLDPPFNSNANYAAPIGSEAAGAEFNDTWGLNDINLAWHGLIKGEHPALYKYLDAVRELHSDSMMSYLIYMIPRIMEMKRLLKATASIYLHCDSHASHYLKLVMDSVFGGGNFRNEINWYYKNASRGKKEWAHAHDVILWYGKDSTSWVFNRDNILAPFDSKMTEWRHRKEGQAGKPSPQGNTPDDVITLPSLNSMAKERTGYPTQKPLALLRLIINASSHEGDIVLDPFCGCATTCVAAEQLGRQWAGIDVSPKAADIVRARLNSDVGMIYSGICRTDIPARTDVGTIPAYNSKGNKKYLYGEQGGYCLGCKHHFMIQNFSLDHIIPKSKGGTDHISNLQLLCGSCNSIKGDRPHEELLIRLIDKGYVKRERGG